MSSEKRIAKFDMVLTRPELLHLRDLMGVCLPTGPEQQTVSMMLADIEGRPNVDETLWEKITEACKLAKLALEDDAPDYIIAPTSAPMLAVFRLQADEDLVEVPVRKEEEEEDDDVGQQAVSSGADIVRGTEQTDKGDTLPSSGGTNEKDAKRKQRRVSSGDRKKRRSKGSE